jgi:hypothetical protein
MLEAGSLNVVAASLDALKSIYPNDKDFRSPAAARADYSARHRRALRT